PLILSHRDRDRFRGAIRIIKVEPRRLPIPAEPPHLTTCVAPRERGHLGDRTVLVNETSHSGNCLSVTNGATRGTSQRTQRSHLVKKSIRPHCSHAIVEPRNEWLSRGLKPDNRRHTPRVVLLGKSRAEFLPGDLNDFKSPHEPSPVAGADS